MARTAADWFALLLLVVAMTLVCVTAGAQGVGLEQATATEKGAASDAYKRGVTAMQAKRYDEALEHLKKSYDIVKSPNSNFMIARLLREMGRKADAHATAKKVIAESEEAAAIDPKYRQTAEHARALVEELSAEVGLVSLIVDAPADSTLRIDDREIARVDWAASVAVDPGDHTIVLETPSKRYEESITVAAGEGKTVVLPPAASEDPGDAPPVDEPGDEEPSDGADPEFLRNLSYVSFGVGGVGVVLFGVFGGLALSTFNDLEDSCPDGRCPPDKREDADRGDAFQTTANVGLVVGIVGIAAGVSLLVTSLVLADEPAEEQAVRVGPGSLSVSF